MGTVSLDALTPSERNVLRALLHERDQKTVARVLGLSPETVKTHLRNAREKCGVHDSFSLAKALESLEGPTPDRGITRDGGGDEPRVALMVQPVEEVTEHGRLLDEVAEERVPFRFTSVPVESPPAPLRKGSGLNLNGGGRLLVAGALVIAVMLAIILAFPLSESFQRFANELDAPSNH